MKWAVIIFIVLLPCVSMAGVDTVHHDEDNWITSWSSLGGTDANWGTHGSYYLGCRSGYQRFLFVVDYTIPGGDQIDSALLHLYVNSEPFFVSGNDSMTVTVEYVNQPMYEGTTADPADSGSQNALEYHVTAGADSSWNVAGVAGGTDIEGSTVYSRKVVPGDQTAGDTISFKIANTESSWPPTNVEQILVWADNCDGEGYIIFHSAEGTYAPYVVFYTSATGGAANTRRQRLLKNRAGK